jgi:hypothetical protein
MRILIVLATVLAGLYGGYWFVGRSAVSNGAESLVTELRARGWDIGYSDMTTVGFPSRFDTTVTDLAVREPEMGIVWQAPVFQVFALSYRPNRVIAVWPGTQMVRVAGQDVAVTSQNLRASAAVTPSTDLALDNITVDGTGLSLSSNMGWTAALARGLFAFRASGPGPTDYDLFVEGTDLVLPADMTARLDPDGSMPASIATLRIDSGLTLDQALDRHLAGEVALRGLNLRALQLTWGDVTLSGNGTLTIDERGVPEGRITLGVQNWDRLIALAVAAGIIDAGLAPTIGNVATALAAGGDTVSLPLGFQGGQMSLGPLPLGAAPRFN